MSNAQQPIQSLPEALTVLGSVNSDISRLNAFFGVFSKILTGTETVPVAPEKEPQRTVGASVKKPEAIPPTLAERVLQIVLESGKPVSPREILTAYQEKKDWPEQDYNAITGSLSYLTNKKLLLTKTDAGYSPTPLHHDFQTSRNDSGATHAICTPK